MSSSLVEKRVHRGHLIEIHYDGSPSSPREDYNVGTIVGWHRLHSLGDVPNPPQDPMNYTLRELVHPISESLYTWVENVINYDDNPKVEQLARDHVQKFLDKHYVILPVYMYEHSGVALSTGEFSCRWDSGQVGFIYAGLDRAKEAFVDSLEWSSVTKWTPELVEKVTKCLEQEVETYGKYLNGEVYGFIVKKLCAACEVLDEDEITDRRHDCPHCEEVEDGSCWGFIGDMAYCRSEAKSVAEHHANDVDESRSSPDLVPVGKDVRWLWKQFDTPTFDEKIEEPFLHFPVGTHREVIWKWFETTFNVSVAELSGQTSQENEQ